MRAGDDKDLREYKTELWYLGPFEIGIHISLETSAWTDFFIKYFWKRIDSISFWPIHLRNKFQGLIWIFVEVIFNFFAGILTYIKSTAAVTVHLEDFGFKNSKILKDVYMR